MKYKIIDAIGQLFTAHWVKTQENEKLGGFDRSAELCLRDENSYTVGMLIARILFVTGIIFAALSAVCWSSFFFWGFMSIAWFGIIMIVAVGKWLASGKTPEAIAKEWKPLRKRLLKYGVIQNIQKKYRQGEGGARTISGAEARRFLPAALDHSMGQLYEKLRKAEQEGFPKKEALIKAQMEQLRDTTKLLGIEMNFDSYFSSRRKEAVRVFLTVAEVPLKH